MTPTLQDLAWHRSAGQLIEHLDKADFWRSLSRLIGEYVPVDTWAVLLFSDGRPFAFAESPYQGEGPDPLFHDYIKGLYLLDPFYIANREQPATGLFRLADVAPERFKETEYYERYFTHYVEQDELQYNVQLDEARSLCLSLGSRQMFTPEQISLLDMIRPWVVGLMRQRMFFESAMAESVPRQAPRWQDNLEEAMVRLGTPLTARELDVIRLILSGCSNKEVASKLSISAETVKVHRRHVYTKLNIKSPQELFSLFLKAQVETPGGEST
ncbi:helix-turn-helix transcriptional regulator [Pseudomonas sp. 14P_8.1_Bac3]|uniref:helix-turn-helix domain-containing protein n=1 Tax=Pseudomonas sp. 14P_8.1_Bac3 TaxID=2971621 RepID=UPI0021C86E76|nr:helix-turn-helix transcriptional regulator [Pseudomonas sp. 14P_8.1_Bac3]MCU1758460.1 helix-turn-helix transcriptional regulator [Pseudomonas sp. 14P_8.1_Bac3]